MIRTFGAVAATALAATVLVTATGAEAQSAKIPVFKNCTAMNKVYRHGVGKVGAHDHSSGKPVTTFLRNNKIYAANIKRDGDHDGVACEKH